MWQILNFTDNWIESNQGQMLSAWLGLGAVSVFIFYAVMQRLSANKE